MDKYSKDYRFKVHYGIEKQIFSESLHHAKSGIRINPKSAIDGRHMCSKSFPACAGTPL